MVTAMADHDCIIGIINHYEGYELTTVENLKNHVTNRIEFNQSLNADGLKRCVWLYYKEWALRDYCDKRKNTNLTRFDYCPECGKKIDWKRIKDGDGDDL